MGSSLVREGTRVHPLISRLAISLVRTAAEDSAALVKNLAEGGRFKDGSIQKESLKFISDLLVAPPDEMPSVDEIQAFLRKPATSVEDPSVSTGYRAVLDVDKFKRAIIAAAIAGTPTTDSLTAILQPVAEYLSPYKEAVDQLLGEDDERLTQRVEDLLGIEIGDIETGASEALSVLSAAAEAPSEPSSDEDSPRTDEETQELERAIREEFGAGFNNGKEAIAQQMKVTHARRLPNAEGIWEAVQDNVGQAQNEYAEAIKATGLKADPALRANTTKFARDITMLAYIKFSPFDRHRDESVRREAASVSSKVENDIDSLAPFGDRWREAIPVSSSAWASKKEEEEEAEVPIEDILEEDEGASSSNEEIVSRGFSEGLRQAKQQMIDDLPEVIAAGSSKLNPSWTQIEGLMNKFEGEYLAALETGGHRAEITAATEMARGVSLLFFLTGNKFDQKDPTKGIVKPVVDSTMTMLDSLPPFQSAWRKFEIIITMKNMSNRGLLMGPREAGDIFKNLYSAVKDKIGGALSSITDFPEDELGEGYKQLISGIGSDALANPIAVGKALGTATVPEIAEANRIMREMNDPENPEKRASPAAKAQMIMEDLAVFGGQRQSDGKLPKGHYQTKGAPANIPEELGGSVSSPEGAEEEPPSSPDFMSAIGLWEQKSVIMVAAIILSKYLKLAKPSF
jgi:hypothetical protein